MAKFIKLTSMCSNQVVYINVDKIELIETNSFNEVYITTTTKFLIVKESIEEVLTLINQ